jgi:hypothetical protein
VTTLLDPEFRYPVLRTADDDILRVLARDVGRDANGLRGGDGAQGGWAGGEVDGMQLGVVDVEEAQRLGGRMVMGAFAEGAGDLEVWLDGGREDCVSE